MRHRLLLLLALLAAFSPVSFGQLASRNRVMQDIDESKLARVKGNVSRFARSEYDAGKADDSLEMPRVTMVFRLSADKQTELEALLKEQVDARSPNYHKWLTPEEFGTRFGLSESDFNKITSWLQSRGLQLVSSPKSRTSITFTGTAGQISAALRTDIHNYIIDGKRHYANATEPAIPAAFADVVLGFRSLNSFRPKPRRVVVRKVKPNFTSEVSGNHYLAPDDIATIYNVKGLHNAGFDGSGQKIVVVGQTDIIQSDITAFRAISGLSTKAPQVVLVPGSSDPGVVSGDIEEANLDIQWAGAVAKNATIIYVNSGNGAFDSLQYAIENNLAPVISVSYGSCEANFTSSDISILTAWGQQANAQGITVAAAAGDSGAADCDYNANIATGGLAVDLPAALPYVTGIGGTRFSEGDGNYWSTTNNSSNGSVQSYIPEVAWNDTSDANGLSSTGGGLSRIFSRPSWQTGTGVPSGGLRAVPDVSFAASGANDGYLVCSQGSCVNGYRDADGFLTVFGGTSAGAPVFSGILALLNQKTGTPQGNVNPTLYSLAASTPTVFHDVTSGDNKVPCRTGTLDCASGGTIGYSTGAGYDLVTGLGSVDSFVLASALGGNAAPSPDFQLTSASSTLTLSTGTATSAAITATALNGFDGAIAWSCAVSSGLVSSATCSVIPEASTPNAKAMLTVTALKKTASANANGRSRSALWLVACVLPFGLVVSPQCRTKLGVGLKLLCVLALAGAMIGAVGCGGGGTTTTSNSDTSSSSSSVTGTVTVQATSGATSHSLVVTVTVQ